VSEEQLDRRLRKSPALRHRRGDRSDKRGRSDLFHQAISDRGASGSLHRSRKLRVVLPQARACSRSSHAAGAHRLAECAAEIGHRRCSGTPSCAINVRSVAPLQPERSAHLRHPKTVLRQQFFVGAIEMNKFISQREATEVAACPAIPSDFLDARTKPAMRYMFFDDDDTVMAAK